MRTYVSTLGYHGERVTRPVVKRGLDPGDEVVVVRPDDDGDGRAAEAIDHVRTFLAEVERDVSIAVERVDTDGFEAAVLECSDVLRSAEGELVVNLGGGAREVFLPLTIATVMHAPLVDEALQYRDVDQQVRSWRVPDLTASVPESGWFVLEILDDAGGQCTVPELTRRSDNSKSTVARWVSELDDRGLVETDRDGKTKVVTASFTARLLLEARAGAAR